MIVKLAEKFVVGFVYFDRACNTNALIEKCFDSERIRKMIHISQNDQLERASHTEGKYR